MCKKELNIIYGDITRAKSDVIVNAANGIGFMGGIIGRLIPLPGVAEAIHYATKGKVEKEAKKNAKKVWWLPRIFCGHRAGECYVTSAGGLSAYWIIHAVTMPYPGMTTSLETVKSLLTIIIREARMLGAMSISIPLLGTGTGGLDEKEVLELYKETLNNVDNDLDIQIVVYKKRGT